MRAIQRDQEHLGRWVLPRFYYPTPKGLADVRSRPALRGPVRRSQHYNVKWGTDPVLISITRLRVRSLWFLPGFIFYALRSARQARSIPGNLDTGLLREANNTYWTRTAWQDETAMRAFMMAMPHRRAMGLVTSYPWPSDSRNVAVGLAFRFLSKFITQRAARRKQGVGSAKS